MAKFTRKRLGDILLEAGAVEEKQLEDALVVQKKTKSRLGQILIDKGYITEDKLFNILEKQFGAKHIDLYEYNIDPEAVKVIPADLAHKYNVIPIKKEKRKLTLAMSDPSNIIAIDDLAMVTGFEIEPVLASENAISRVIDQHFAFKDSLEKVYKSIGASGALEGEEKELLDAAPIVQMVNSMIENAVSKGASDIHMDPLEKNLKIRMRIDGVLYDVMNLPKDAQSFITSRIKIMANMDISEKRLPQDGRIIMNIRKKELNMRVSTLPTVFGEKVVVRLLEQDKIIMPLKSLGLNKNNYKLFERLITSPYGMILVTGPTGCGKTTTLYSALNFINSSEKNIITVEDPVEFNMLGINQVQVKPSIGLTFAGVLRSILRQDPNIIMIGEIRDAETAEIAVRAALTGHLVLSTLHTNDAPRALTRLTDMGIEPFLITSSVIGVMTQRLVRTICKDCRIPYDPTPEERKIYSQVMKGMEIPQLYTGRGCGRCSHTGYRGRIAIHELMVINNNIRQLFLDGASIELIRREAVKQGMVTLQEDSFNKVAMGLTTIDEVIKAMAFSET
ncbi:MAG: type II secretion system protein GspE [Firmicutes bacterium HGW-Firmicutes-13]|nr:MAG: type II secretion system protein GspE [Firmicutes bacterium HGW-Firmicutes-13]